MAKMNRSFLRNPACRRLVRAGNTRSRFVSELNGAPFDLEKSELSFKRRSLLHFDLRARTLYWIENVTYICSQCSFLAQDGLTAECVQFH
jgi:hypothetical protein